MELPESITIVDFAYLLDGGSIQLQVIDSAHQPHNVTLFQHAFPRITTADEFRAGRLYFDGQLVELRSEIESHILDLLRRAEFPAVEHDSSGTQARPLPPKMLIIGDDIKQVMTRSRGDNLRALSAEVIQWVESDEYIAFAYQVEMAMDSTRYKVWVACDSDNWKQMVVRLSRYHGLGLKAAREILDNETPLATDLTALESAELARRYVAEGVAVRFEPEFRWRLK